VRAFAGGHEETIIRHSRKAAIVSFCCVRASRFNESASKYVSRIEYCVAARRPTCWACHRIESSPVKWRNGDAPAEETCRMKLTFVWKSRATCDRLLSHVDEKRTPWI
jgi:hypothetical protein